MSKYMRTRDILTFYSFRHFESPSAIACDSPFTLLFRRSGEELVVAHSGARVLVTNRLLAPVLEYIHAQGCIDYLGQRYTVVSKQFME